MDISEDQLKILHMLYHGFRITTSFRSGKWKISKPRLQDNKLFYRSHAVATDDIVDDLKSKGYVFCSHDHLVHPKGYNILGIRNQPFDYFSVNTLMLTEKGRRYIIDNIQTQI